MARRSTKQTAAALRPDVLTDPWQVLHLVGQSLAAVDTNVAAAGGRAEQAEVHYQRVERDGTYRARRRAGSQRREAFDALRATQRARALLQQKQARLLEHTAYEPPDESNGAADSDGAASPPPWAHTVARLRRLVDHRVALRDEVARVTHAVRRSSLQGELRILEQQITAAHRACTGSPAAIHQAMQIDPDGIREAVPVPAMAPAG